MRRCDIIIDMLISKRRYENMKLIDSGESITMYDNFMMDLLDYKEDVLDVPYVALYKKYFSIPDGDDIIGFLKSRNYIMSFCLGSGDIDGHIYTKTEDTIAYQKYDLELKKIIRRNKINSII